VYAVVGTIGYFCEDWNVTEGLSDGLIVAEPQLVDAPVKQYAL
jgi:hypothetical protein